MIIGIAQNALFSFNEEYSIQIIGKIQDNEKMIRIRFINTARIPLRIRCVPLSFFMSYASFSLVNLLISPCAPPITRSDNTKMPTEIQLPYPILLWLKDT